MTTTLTIPTITTERLKLRAAGPQDFEVYADYRASDRARHVGGPNTRGQAFQMLAGLVGQWALRGYGRWIVADKDSDAALGVVGIYHPDDWPEAEIGWTVFAHAEGKGIAYEASVAARTYAYETLGWTRIVSMIAPENTRSQALAARMGAVFEYDYHHPEFGVMPVYRHLSPEELAA